MSLRETLNAHMKEAMRAKEAKRLATIRLILAALKDKDIAARTEESREGIPDAEILQLLGKMIRQRQESAETYENAGRPELAANERAEIAIIEGYLPKQMSEAETQAVVAALIAELGAVGVKDMGRVMGALKERFAGQMDMGKANPIVKALLAG